MKVEKYKCKHCAYVYVYMKYDNGNEMNVPFEDLPEDWVCPTCGKQKKIFEKLDI